MPKFKVELKVQSLELRIEGEREDIPKIQQSITAHMAGLVQPAGPLLEGAELISGDLSDNQTASPPSKKRTKRTRVTQGNSDNESSVAIDFVHDPQTFGNPIQAWKTAEKALWLLYVLSETSQINEASGRTISATFNKHFKQAGAIQVGNVNRDLGRLKVQRPAPVGEDTTKEPPNWYLTDEGRKRAQALMSTLLGEEN